MLTYSLSIYKMVVIAVQILVIYLGFIIVSATDTYGFKAILWNSMNGKKFITAVMCIWICLTLPAIRMLLHLMRNKSLKKNDKTKKTFWYLSSSLLFIQSYFNNENQWAIPLAKPRLSKEKFSNIFPINWTYWLSYNSFAFSPTAK